jgi:hypothetical protein
MTERMSDDQLARYEHDIRKGRWEDDGSLDDLLDECMRAREAEARWMNHCMSVTEWIYEAARLEAMASGRRIVPEPWGERDDVFREQMTEYVESLRGKPLPTPEEAHDSWWQKYLDMGWRYGPERDPVEKTHPDMVPYDDLPKDERDKDEVFLALVEFAFRHIVERRKQKR